MRSKSQQTVTRDALLAQADFVRSLARALVKDPDRADDVAQQTFVTALETPPRETSALRSWLRSVMRNVVRQTYRSDSSRAALERRRTPPDDPERPDAAAQNRETVRDLVETLLEVREPYQTAIFLRYYENLAPRRIASRLGLPVETVKSRLKRGLRELRERMDARGSGDRASWRASLVTLLGLPGGGMIAPQPTTGGELMGTAGWVKIMLAASLVMTTTAIVIVAVRDEAPSQSDERYVARADVEEPEIDVRPTSARDEESVATLGVERSPEVSQTFARPFRVVVRDELGIPIAGARIERVDADDRDDAVSLGTTGRDGVLDSGAPGESFTLVTSASGYATETTSFQRPAQASEPITIVMREGAAIAGSVRFADGRNPGAGVRVYACREGGCLSAYELARGLEDVADSAIVETDAQGRFRVEGLLPGVPYGVFAGAPGIAMLRGIGELGPRMTGLTAIAGGDDLEIVVGHLYGTAARLVEEGGAPLRVTARAEWEVSDWIMAVEEVSGQSDSRFVGLDEPTLALAGIDVAAVHSRFPTPKHVTSRFVVSERDVDSRSVWRTVSAVGYEDAGGQVEAPRIRGDAVSWDDVVMTPADVIRTGDLRIEFDWPASFESAVKRSDRALGKILLSPEGGGPALSLALAPGETGGIIQGIPAGYYHARFRGEGFGAMEPGVEQLAIPVEILEGETATLRFDLGGFGSIVIHAVDADGRQYLRRLKAELEAVDGRTTASGSSRSSFTLRRGPFRIPVLEPGAYRMTVTVQRHGSSRLEPIPVTVYHGDTTEVTIEIPRLPATASQPPPQETIEEAEGIFVEVAR